MHDPDILVFLQRHLNTIMQNDLQAYHETTSEDLTLYEWWVTPHRIDGLPFHDFMMESNAQRGTVFGAELSGEAKTRFDLSNFHVQHYGNTAIASYTLLISTNGPDGVNVDSHNESRVMVRDAGGDWKVVHVHKSPAYQAPHTDPHAK